MFVSNVCPFELPPSSHTLTQITCVLFLHVKAFLYSHPFCHWCRNFLYPEKTKQNKTFLFFFLYSLSFTITQTPMLVVFKPSAASVNILWTMCPNVTACIAASRSHRAILRSCMHSWRRLYHSGICWKKLHTAASDTTGPLPGNPHNRCPEA